MGQAKKRGTFEERKALAIERGKKTEAEELEARVEILRKAKGSGVLVVDDHVCGAYGRGLSLALAKVKDDSIYVFKSQR